MSTEAAAARQVVLLRVLLIISAGYFALATATRSMMWTYVGAAATLLGYLVIRGALRDPQFDTVSALTDPFGLSALAVATKYWTATERNTQLPEMSGLLLANRVLWSAVAIALFAVTHIWNNGIFATHEGRDYVAWADVDKLKALGSNFFVVALRILVIRVAAVDEDVAGVEKGFEFGDGFIHRLALGHHDPDGFARGKFFGHILG